MTPLQLLMLEDSESDAELLLRTLEKGGYDVSWKRVQTAADLNKALDQQNWDIIISDYSMPSFSGLEGLQILKDRGIELPFIIVSGTIGEDTAVRAMKAGAHDYLMKDKLARLIPAIQRELRDHAERVKQKETERALKEKDEQLRHSQKMEAVGLLAGGIAHDFNNALSVIQMYCDIILDKLQPDGPTVAEIRQIAKATTRAASLTRQLLAFSRKQILEPRILNLNSIVSDIQQMLPRFIGENIQFHTKLEPDMKSVRVDYGQFEQVLMNLAVNSRDAMPKGGDLTIETRMVEFDGPVMTRETTIRPGRYAVLIVRDTGCGMTDEVKSRIFEPFFTTKGVGRGTGLGLSTLYGIVKQSGGEVLVESEVGKGTTFQILVPVVDLPNEPTATAAQQVTSLQGNETILLVEDQEDLRTVMAEILEARGYTVLRANNGKEALEIAKSHKEKIHLLITDVVMPEISGPDLASRFEAIRGRTQVLYVSGYLDDTISELGVITSQPSYLQKPFTAVVLAQKVRAAIEAGYAEA